MRAVAVAPSTKQLSQITLPQPAITAPTQVLLRTIEVGVCGTDREIVGGHYGIPPEGQSNLVIGHEALLQVAEVGRAVKNFKPGDLVVPTVRRPCHEENCPSCKVGRQDFCYSGLFTERGIKQQHGYMTEFIVEDEQFLIPVPEDIRDIAVMVEPLTIAEKALIEVWQVQQRLPWACPLAGKKSPGHCHHALVLGAGPIGLLGAMAFAAAGFSTFVYSREAEDSDRAELVRSFSATYISSQVTSIEKIVERIGTIDVVYEATGASRLAFDMLQQVGPNAAFVFAGVPGIKGRLPVDADFIMRNMVLKNQVLLGTVNAGKDAFEAAMRDLGVFKQKWPKAIKALMTGRYKLEDYRTPLLSTDGIKNVIEFSAVQ